MKKNIIILLFIVLSITFVRNNLYAQSNEFFDITTEVVYGEECLKDWQIEEASKIADKLLLIAPEDPYVCFFAGKVRFYEGKYKESLSFLQKAQKEQQIIQKGKEIYDFVKEIHQPASKFKEIQTEHFTFRFVDEKDAILAEYALDTLEKAYNAIGSDLGYYPQDRILVEVYPDIESFCTISTLTRKEIETSGTVAICLFNRVIITSPRLQPRGYEWLDTLTHEYVHYVIMKKTYNRVPVWLHEGIAKFEEVRWFSDDLPELPVSLESLLAEAVEKDYFISFDQMHPSLAKLKKREDTALAFAEVFTVIDYLYNYGGYPLIKSVLDEIKQGRSAKEAISTAMNMPFDTFEKSWLQDLKKKNLRRIHGIQILPTKLQETSTVVDDIESVAEIEAKEAKKFAVLGDLLRGEGLYNAAVIEYEKAYNKAKNISPQIQNKLAKAYIMQSKYEKAEDILKIALEYYPGYTTSYITLGELYQKKGDYHAAIEILTKANYVNPFNPIIHDKLIQLYTQIKDEENAEKERERLKLVIKSNAH